jgi:hypothetical protein
MNPHDQLEGAPHQLFILEESSNIAIVLRLSINSKSSQGLERSSRGCNKLCKNVRHHDFGAEDRRAREHF